VLVKPTLAAQAVEVAATATWTVQVKWTQAMCQSVCLTLVHAPAAQLTWTVQVKLTQATYLWCFLALALANKFDAALKAAQ
jgi:hypothetical protein